MVSSRTWRGMGVATVFVTLLTCIPASAQFGGIFGKCMTKSGVPMTGFVVEVVRADKEMKFDQKTKCNKKGEFIYLGLQGADYNLTLWTPDGKPVDHLKKHVTLGDPVEINFDNEPDRWVGGKDEAETPPPQAAAAQKPPEAAPEDQVKKGKQSQAQAEALAKAQAARAEYEKQAAAQKENQNLVKMFGQARDLAAAKQYSDAAALLEKALPYAKDKNLAIVTSALADNYSKAAGTETDPDKRKEDQAKALDYYQKVLQTNPDDAAIHNNLGSLYAEMGKSTEAAAEFAKAANLDPSHAGGYYYNFGVTMVNKNQMDEAGKALKQATDLDPTNANAWYWYGMALMGKAQIKADGTLVPAPGTIEAFKAYLKLAPTGQWASAAQGSIDALQGKEAIEYKKKK